MMEAQAGSSNPSIVPTKSEDASGRGEAADVEHGDSRRVPPGQFQQGNENGYYRLAEAMAKVPERLILRSFGTLNAQSLLFYQAELIWLEDEYRKLEKNNCDLEKKEISKTPQTCTRSEQAPPSEPASTSHPAKKKAQSSRNWWALAEAPYRSDKEKMQWELFLRIRQVMEKYSARYDLTAPTFSKTSLAKGRH
jgi:hypothetical protein